MEEMKIAKKRFSRLGAAFLIGTLAINLAQGVTGAIVKYVKPEWLENPDMVIILSMLSMYLLGMPVLVAFTRRVPAQVPEKHSIKKGSFIVAVIMSFGLIYMSNIVGLVITSIIGRLKGSAVQSVMQNMTASTSIPVLVLFTVIVAPIMEELIFRKLVVDRTLRYGQGISVVVSGLMFGLFHGNLNQFVYAFTLGMFLAFLYVKTGNIKITIALHMMINFVGGVLSTLLTRSLDLEELDRITASMDTDAIMEYIMANIGPVLGFMCFSLLVIGVMLAGFILFIVFFVKKKFTLEPGAVIIPKGKRFSTVMLNLGMILFGVYWVVMIVCQLFL